MMPKAAMKTNAKILLLLLLSAITLQPLHAQIVVAQGGGPQNTASWTAATPGNTSLAVQLGQQSVVAPDYNLVAITFNPSGTITGGVITFEITSDPTGNSNYQGLICTRLGSTLTDSTYTLSGVAQTWQCNTGGLAVARVRLSTGVNGSGTVAITIKASAASAGVTAAAAGAAGGTSAADKAGFTVGTTPGTPIQAAVAPVDTVVAGTVATVAADTARNLKVNCVVGCASASDTTASGAIGALNANVQIAMAGLDSASFTTPAGNNLVATLTAQYSSDGATTWIATNLRAPGGQWTANVAVSSTQNTWNIQVPGGASHVRVIATAFTSGTATVAVRGTLQPELVLGVNGTPANPIPPFTALIGGSDGTNLRALNTDNTGKPNVNAVGTLANNGAAAATNRVGTLPSIAQTSYNNGIAATQGRDEALNAGTDGLLWVANLPAIRPASYSASSKFAASSTTDNCVLPGNASNTVLMTEVRVTGVQTTAGILNIEVAKRSTADTAGTSAAMTAVPDDSNNAAAVSAPLSYTGTGPTVGTLVGDIDNAEVGFLAPGTASANDIYVGNFRQKPIVLRGTAQMIAVNLGGAVTGGTMTCTFKWIETATITP